MSEKKDRLKEIQSQLDLLMEEVRKLQSKVRDEGRRRTYPFPFEPGVVDHKPPSGETKSRNAL